MVDNGVVRAQAYQTLGKETVTIAGKSREATKVSRTSENKQVIVWVVEGLPGARAHPAEEGWQRTSSTWC